MNTFPVHLHIHFHVTILKYATSSTFASRSKVNNLKYMYTVEPHYNEVLGTMKITLLYQVSHYIRGKKKKYKELGPAKLPCYKRVLLYPTSL